MFGSFLSVLLMGMVPVWGTQENVHALSGDLQVAPPAFSADVLSTASLQTLSASGVIVTDLNSGQMLFGRAEDSARPMASLTKLMTALLIVENHALEERVTVPADIADTEGNIVYLPPGETFSVGDLLSALLITSANDAAVTLARFHSGSTDAFVAEMNRRARELGLTRTSYQNPAGFDAPTQKSSPRDLAWLAMFVLTKASIADRMALSNTQIHGSHGTVISLVHTHALLHINNQNDSSTGSSVATAAVVQAGKTGTTDEAGQCLLSIVEVGGRRYVTVLLHSRDRYADLQQVLTLLPR